MRQLYPNNKGDIVANRSFCFQAKLHIGHANLARNLRGKKQNNKKKKTRQKQKQKSTFKAVI